MSELEEAIKAMKWHSYATVRNTKTVEDTVSNTIQERRAERQRYFLL